MQLSSLLPICRWLPQYDRAWLRPDLVAGITLAAYAIPVSLAYAALAGLPQIRQRAKAQADPRRVFCDLSNVPFVDVAGARMLLKLHEELSAREIEFKVVEAHGPVRDLLRAEGLEEKVGVINRFSSLAELLNDQEATTSPLVKIPNPKSQI